MSNLLRYLLISARSAVQLGAFGRSISAFEAPAISLYHLQCTFFLPLLVLEDLPTGALRLWSLVSSGCRVQTKEPGWVADEMPDNAKRRRGNRRLFGAGMATNEINICRVGKVKRGVRDTIPCSHRRPRI